jgi:hypothetical protein
MSKTILRFYPAGKQIGMRVSDVKGSSKRFKSLACLSLVSVFFFYLDQAIARSSHLFSLFQRKNLMYIIRHDLMEITNQPNQIE